MVCNFWEAEMDPLDRLSLRLCDPERAEYPLQHMKNAALQGSTCTVQWITGTSKSTPHTIALRMTRVRVSWTGSAEVQSRSNSEDIGAAPFNAETIWSQYEGNLYGERLAKVSV